MNSKVLVIEDESDILENIKLILESESFVVHTARDGYEGIKYANLNKPDLIICDIAMPGISGYEVLKILTKNENFSTPFIFLTAQTDRKDLRKGMELGADDYITKPFTANELITAIDTRLAKHKRIIGKVISTNNDFSKSGKDKIETPESILIKYNKKLFPIIFKDIIYIKAENQYSQLFLESQKNFVLRKSLTDWLNILPENLFIRISRSVVINNEYVENAKIKDNGLYELEIKNVIEKFRVSRKYLKNFKNNFSSLFNVVTICVSNILLTAEKLCLDFLF